MEVKQGQQIVICPNCGGNKVQRTNAAVTLFISAGCLVWIPIIGWILAPFIFIIAIVAMFLKGKDFNCRECKYTLTVSDDVYREYKEYLRAH